VSGFITDASVTLTLPSDIVATTLGYHLEQAMDELGCSRGVTDTKLEISGPGASVMAILNLLGNELRLGKVPNTGFTQLEQALAVSPSKGFPFVLPLITEEEDIVLVWTPGTSVAYLLHSTAQREGGKLPGVAIATPYGPSNVFPYPRPESLRDLPALCQAVASTAKRSAIETILVRQPVVFRDINRPELLVWTAPDDYILNYFPADFHQLFSWIDTYSSID